jgi:hypothetical protein
MYDRRKLQTFASLEMTAGLVSLTQRSAGQQALLQSVPPPQERGQMDGGRWAILPGPWPGA